MQRSIFFVLICLSLLSISCSTKMAYNFLDWAIEWQVKRMVSLNGEQKLFLKDAADRFHIWHRYTQLPQYSDYLTSVASRLEEGPLNAQEIHAETDKVQLLMDQSLEQALPELAKLMEQLNDKQTLELQKHVADERQEYVEEYVEISHDKQLKKRVEDFTDHFKPWVGSLNKQQKARIQLWSQQLKPYEALNVEQQKRWEGQLKETLANRHDADALEAGLRGLMFYRTDTWLPELEKILDYNQALTYQLIEDLLKSLSEKQYQHMLEELHDYARICRELADKKES